MSGEASRPRVMFVITEDWYFMSHRLPIARAALAAGYEVLVAARVQSHFEAIRAEGFTPVPLRRMRRSGKNPFAELLAIGELVGVFRRYRPDIVHQVAMKPVLYGSFAARLCGVEAVVNTLAGLGFVFSSTSAWARLLRPVVGAALRFALGRRQHVTIVQNRDDFAAIEEGLGIDAAKICLIKGSGVDLADFPQGESKAVPPVVLLASRLIWDKGITDFAAAAVAIRARGISARFLLAGAPDLENPNAIPLSLLETYANGHPVEWLGRRDDIAALMATASIVCLPTVYGEGVPKVLIEAAAARAAIVAYDVPGCREIVRDGANGWLVAAKDVPALTDRLAGLIEDPEQCERMGAAGRSIVEAEFSQEYVIAQTLSLYSRMLGRQLTPVVSA